MRATPRDKAFLIKCLKDMDPHVRGLAADSLGDMKAGAGEAVSALLARYVAMQFQYTSRRRGLGSITLSITAVMKREISFTLLSRIV